MAAMPISLRPAAHPDPPTAWMRSFQFSVGSHTCTVVTRLLSFGVYVTVTLQRLRPVESTPGLFEYTPAGIY